MVTGVRIFVSLAAVAVFIGGLTSDSSASGLAFEPMPTVSVLSPNPSSTSSWLSSMCAVSARNAWAVGGYLDDLTGAQDALVLHWDGTSWSQVASPNPSSSINELRGVSADSATDAWAVGDYFDDTGIYETLILHWDGTSWSQVATPNPSSSFNGLWDVSADPSSDAWAVGNWFGKHGYERTLILHWDGVSWTRVASPDPGSEGNYLSGVSAVSATDAWAVGEYWHYDKTTAKPAEKTLTLHWDGTRWKKVKSPNSSLTHHVRNSLSDVSAASPSDVWAVGGYWSRPSSFHLMILHWDGTSWKKVGSPNPSSTSNELLGVSVVSAKNAWAVGEYDTTAAGHTLILHWDGTRWNKVRSPNPSSTFNILGDVSAVSAKNVWAVGHYDTTAAGDTLILHWDGTSWSKV